MLGEDEDVFDSVTWESAAANTYDPEETPPSGPGFRQSTADSTEGPHDPKWEGYLVTTVKDPVKELAETKDAYVSYLVQAKVSLLFLRILVLALNVLIQDQPTNILHTKPNVSPSLPGFCLLERKPRPRLSCLCSPSFARKAPIGFVI